jgi:type I restriction enzyme, S subunit
VKYKPYPKYKVSGVEWLGDVPDGWKTWRLRFGVELNPSKAEIAEFARDVEVSFLPMEAIGENGELDLRHNKTISAVETGYTYFRNGDVVMAKITPCFENGKGARVTGLVNGIGFGTTELVVARANFKTDGSFIQWLFVSQPFRKLGEGHMYGAGGQKRLPDDFVRNFEMAWPSPSEQSAIATFLDRETAKIDTLITKQEKLINLLKEKRQAVISHAVTRGLDPNVPMKPSGVEWLGDVPEHWNIPPIRAISQVVRGASPRPAGDPKFFGGDHTPWVTVGEITKDDAMFLIGTSTMLTSSGADQSRLFSSGTLVLSNSGATLGVPKILQIDACANDGVVGFESLAETVDIHYLYYYLLSLTQNLRERIKQGSGQPNLNTDIVKEIQIGLPPLSEQEKIVKWIDGQLAKIDLLISKAQQAIALQKEHRTALISAAVTGKIDVRVAAVQTKKAA